MPMSRLSVLPFLLLSAFLAALGGCQKTDSELQLADLSEGEHRYVSRIVVLERAKAVALIDRTAGYAVLDSLAVAWGDSALEKTLVGAPSDPRRSERVHELLTRILKTERDSLILAPRTDRLAEPIPDPLPIAPPEAANPETGQS